MAPKRALSPTSAAKVADAKRQAVEEQRLRAEEFARNFLNSPTPKIGTTEETPSKSRKRLSSAIPGTTDSTKEKRAKKSSDELQTQPFGADLDSSSAVQSAAQTPRGRGRKSIISTIPETAVEYVVAETATIDDKSRISNTAVDISTPHKRNRFSIPNESLNAASNPPKLVPGKISAPPTPSLPSTTSAPSTSHKQNPRKILSSLPIDEEEVSVDTPSPKSKVGKNRRSSFSTLTHRFDDRNNQSDSTEERQEQISSEVIGKKTPVRAFTKSVTESPKSEVKNNNLLSSNIVDKDGDIAEEKEVTANFWDSIIPYLWIIIYIQLMVILAVVLYYADTRLIGITAIVVSLFRRIFHYLV